MFLDQFMEGHMLLRSLAMIPVLLGTYLLGLVVYRLYFHPLAHYPGPFWAKVSGLPAMYHCFKKNRHIWFWRLQQEYGPTFRYTPDSILVNTPTGYKQIFSPKANIGKSDYYRAVPRNVDAIGTWNTTSKVIHARKRRVLNTAFSDKAMRSAEPFIHNNVNRWLDLMEEDIVSNGGEWSSPLNLATWANHLVFDILGDLCFGKPFGLIEHDSKMRHLPELMADFIAILHPVCMSPFVPWIVWLKPKGLDSFAESNSPQFVRDWLNFVANSFQERAEQEEEIKRSGKSEEETRKDFFHYLFRATDPETGKQGYTTSELLAETENLIVAGSDTTAISMAAASFYMVRNPGMQKRLYEELRSVFDTIDDIKGGNRLQSDCKYLQAFIKETLRISPPATTDLPREVLKGGTIVDGQFLPEGVHVTSNPYCMHMDPELYDEPFKFKPERWILGEKGTTAESLARADSGYSPFSTGLRGCAGKNLAYLELSIVVAKMVWRFEMKQNPDSNNLGGGKLSFEYGRQQPEQYQLYDAFVGMRDGPLVHMRKREV